LLRELAYLQTVEELVRRSLRNARLTSYRLPEPDPCEIRAPTGLQAFNFSTAIATEDISATFVVTNPTGSKLQRRLIVIHGF